MKFRRPTRGPLSLAGVDGALRRLRRGLDRLPGRRGMWLWAGGLLGAFLVGYVIAATVLFPAPIFARTAAVPRVIGMPQERAEATLTGAGLQVAAVTTEPHASIERGSVIWQDPPEGIAVPQGQAVSLVVSSGPQRIPVPDVSGYDVSLAKQLVAAAGLRTGSVESTQAPAPAGVVINSRPPAGGTLLPGTEITLVVSVGAPTISVPDLRGLTRDVADSVLQQAGLGLGTAMQRTSIDRTPGTVIGQSPAPGTLSAPGTSVNITIARRRN